MNGSKETEMENKPTKPAPANDNPRVVVSFTDLAASLGLDKNTLIERLGDIFSERKATPDDQ